MIRKSFISKVTGSVFLTTLLVSAPIKLVSVAELEESQRELYETQAYYTALSGIHEATVRLMLGEFKDLKIPRNPAWQVEIYPRPLPRSRGDTLCVSTLQEPEHFLPYCSSDSPLKIHYRLDEEDLDQDGLREEILYYDPANPEVRSVKPEDQFLPIYVITSTGVEGSVKKTLEMEVVLEKGSGRLLMGL